MKIVGTYFGINGKRGDIAIYWFQIQGIGHAFCNENLYKADVLMAWAERSLILYFRFFFSNFTRLWYQKNSQESYFAPEIYFLW